MSENTDLNSFLDGFGIAFFLVFAIFLIAGLELVKGGVGLTGFLLLSFGFIIGYTSCRVYSRFIGDK